MNLCKLYSLTLGAKITKPYLNPVFYPLPFNKYIVIQGISKPSKNWGYWSELIEFIKPELDKQDIKLVSVGGKQEENLPNCYHTAGSTSFQQLEFIIQNAIAYVGCDSISAHFAGAFDIPRIVLVSNNHAENVKPYFGSPEKQIVIEPPREEGEKPSFMLDEGPNSQINRIPPETVIDAVNQLLGLSVKTVNSIHFGENYNSSTVEAVPDCPFTLQIPANQIIQVRLDYLNELTPANYQHTLQLAAQRKVMIYADKPFNLDPFKQVRQNIAAIVYRMTEGGDIEFVKSLKRGGFQFRVVKEYLSDKEYCATKKELNGAINEDCAVKNNIAPLTPEQIAELKFKYLDVAPIQFVEKKKVELEWRENLTYMSKRLIFSNNLIYRSKNNFKKGLTNNENQTKILDNQELKELQEEADYLYIYERN